MANVKLSAAETELVTNAASILTKNRIIEKVYGLFGALAEDYKQHSSIQNIPQEILAVSPKISKGEQYNQLPWVMLDYPRYFKAKDVFAIRTFFWWGHFFSIQLHLKGRYKEALPINQIPTGWFIYTGTDEWDHNMNTTDFVIAESWSTEQIQQLPFLKMGKKISLENWDKAPDFLTDAFNEIITKLRFN